MLNKDSRTASAAAADEIMDTLARLFSKAAAIEHEPVDTGDGILLYTSEVHLIDVAGRFPEESMSSLAVRLGVTKGAISQTAKKLEKKGYLKRVNREGNNKTLFIQLTESGDKAYDWHRAYHTLVNESIAQEIITMGGRERETIQRTLLLIERVFDNCPETRRRITDSILKGTRKKT